MCTHLSPVSFVSKVRAPRRYSRKVRVVIDKSLEPGIADSSSSLHDSDTVDWASTSTIRAVSVLPFIYSLHEDLLRYYWHIPIPFLGDTTAALMEVSDWQTLLASLFIEPIDSGCTTRVVSSMDSL